MIKIIHSKTAYYLIKKNNIAEDKGFMNLTYKNIKISGVRCGFRQPYRNGRSY